MRLLHMAVSVLLFGMIAQQTERGGYVMTTATTYVETDEETEGHSCRLSCQWCEEDEEETSAHRCENENGDAIVIKEEGDYCRACYLYGY